MRLLIPVAVTLTLAAATAAGMALHSAPARPLHQHAHATGAAVPTDAEPGLVWRSGTATLRLTDQPCPSQDLVRALDGEGVVNARAYEVTQGKQRSVGCWTKDLGGDVLTAEQGREIGSIPVDWFRREARTGT